MLGFLYKSFEEPFAEELLGEKKILHNRIKYVLCALKILYWKFDLDLENWWELEKK